MLNKYLILMNLAATVMANSMFITMSTKQSKIMLEWNLTKTASTNMSMKMMLDMKSTAFLSCVSLITTAIILYSKFYMKTSNKKNKFMKLIMVFIMSMTTLILSPNMITAILGWEGLGMSSFMLILFYQNKKSLNSSFFTMLMNRAGDIMLILGMTKMMNTSSWYFDSLMFNESHSMMMMMTLAAFSKSAQIPFSSWLTEAMAAPTPISALVHSSTLVTAGVLILIRFESALKYTSLNWMIMVTSMATLLMASMNSLTEWDIKKIIALSTLSQLTMMFISISMNLFNLAMFHMLVHATFKALIFACSSSFIAMSNTQDMRNMKTTSKNMFFTQMSFNLANLTLMGFPFMSSFFSKEMIMEMVMMKKSNWIFLMMFYSCMMVTICYSMKMMLFLNTGKKVSKFYSTMETPEQKMSKILLLLPSIVYGNKINWIMNMNFKIITMEKSIKIAPPVMMLLVMMNIKVSFKKKEMMKTSEMMKKMKIYANYMWFMKNMSINMKKTTLKWSMNTFKNSEKISLNEKIKMMKKGVNHTSKMMFSKTHTNTKKINMMILISLMMML